MDPKQAQMGSGMAQGAAEVLALMPTYKLEKADAMSQGLDFPDFREWAIKHKALNAPKIIPAG